MKKLFYLPVYIFLCLLISLMFSTAGKADEKVDSGDCNVVGCHYSTVPGATDDPTEEHNRHPTGTVDNETGLIVSCSSCHDNGVGELGDVSARSCPVCHFPLCESVTTHEDDPAREGAVCLTPECHPECAPITTTTTTVCTAEAIYGIDSKEINLLKAYRDDVLSRTPEGRKLIKLYYNISPMIVVAIEKNEKFRDILKKKIDELLPIIEAQVLIAEQ